MNSPGHPRQYPLHNTAYHKIGIGVLDGGIWQDNFVQGFTD